MSSTEAVAVSSMATRRRLLDAGLGLVAASSIGVLFARNGFDADSLVDAFTIAVLVVISREDIDRRIIPNRIVVPAWAIVLVANVALHPGQWWHWLLASFGCGYLFYVFARFSNGGVGMGDVKLVAFLGAALGGDVLSALVLGTALGALVSIAIIVRHGAEGRTRTIPYGPFLAAGAIAVLIFL
jgi:prepilin signal peptidase PulO-like enzyme (type II secretory pathway)